MAVMVVGSWKMLFIDLRKSISIFYENEKRFLSVYYFSNVIQMLKCDTDVKM